MISDGAAYSLPEASRQFRQKLSLEPGVSLSVPDLSRLDAKNNRTDHGSSADRRQDAFLLNADGGIAETRSEFERIDAVVIDDAIQVNVADVAFLGELRLHFQKRLREQAIGLAPEHGRTHFSG